MNLAPIWDKLPSPPQVGPFKDGAFRSRLHDERTAAILGISLAVTFTTCFATGLYSHEIAHPASWFTPFARPAGLFRFTQGLHVATGLASVPLLFAKLWTVFPKLFAWPPFKTIAQAVERIFLLPLIGGALFLLYSGVNNINGRYPYGKFSFPEAHFWAAWITIGGLVVHVGAKITTTRTALRRGHLPHVATPTAVASTATDPGTDTGGASGVMSRRGFMGVVFGTSGLVTLFTVGQTFAPLRKFALLAPRRPDTGPQGFPVNDTAIHAGITRVDLSTYRLKVHGVGVRTQEFSIAELRALGLHEAELPIACVEGWSTSQRWRGVALRDLLDHVGAPNHAAVTLRSIQNSTYGFSNLTPGVARDPDTLLAMEVNGEELHIDHGFPIRLMAPNTPGERQTKWLNEVVVRG